MQRRQPPRLSKAEGVPPLLPLEVQEEVGAERLELAPVEKPQQEQPAGPGELDRAAAEQERLRPPLHQRRVLLPPLLPQKEEEVESPDEAPMEGVLVEMARAGRRVPP